MTCKHKRYSQVKEVSSSCSALKQFKSFLYLPIYRYIYIMETAQAVEIGTCLSNPVRINIMEWLKKPEAYFPPHQELGHFNDGVCATYIKDRTGLSQSTISTYLSKMEKCNLLQVTKHGKWSYFKRREDTITEYLGFLQRNEVGRQTNAPVKDTSLKIIHPLEFQDRVLELLLQLNPNKSSSQILNIITQMVTIKDYKCFGLFQGKHLIGISSGWTSYRVYCGKQLELDNQPSR